MLKKILVNLITKYNLQCSFHRLQAVLIKEFIQMMRDRITFAMIIGIPLMQLVLFGFAINTNPKYLPTVVIDADKSAFTRAFVSGLKNTSYFKIQEEVKNEAEAKKLLEQTRTQFVITIPTFFTRDLIRGKSPEILVEADATDSVATASAISAVQIMAQTVFNPLLKGNLQSLRNARYFENSPRLINVVTHANYNPESITAYNIVPGLMGVVLTMTLVIITSMGITREREKGTMEHLLATPVKPLEVMIGKICPYVIVGYIQMFLILLAAKFLFAVPMHGNIILLMIAVLPFIAANLSVGITFSSLAKTQLQASQMSTFFFLPSILLSGFMFPFRGMPTWAQDVGTILPLTHFLRISRGIVLKGNGIAAVWSDLWPILIFMVVAIAIGLKRYRRTLD